MQFRQGQSLFKVRSSQEIALVKAITANTISVYFINKVNAILDRRNNSKSESSTEPEVSSLIAKLHFITAALLWLTAVRDVITSVRVYEVTFRTWYKDQKKVSLEKVRKIVNS